LLSYVASATERQKATRTSGGLKFLILKKKTTEELFSRSAMVCVIRNSKSFLNTLPQGRRPKKARKPKEKAKVRSVKNHSHSLFLVTQTTQGRKNPQAKNPKSEIGFYKLTQ